MKVPKYIKQLALNRAKYADKASICDYELSKWCEDHEIDLDGCDCFGGCEVYCNPYDSSNRVIEAIENK